MHSLPKINLKITQKLKKFNLLRSWQLLLILIPLLFIIATGLRFDHLKMERLRNEVREADQANNSDQLQKKLLELKNFANSHTIINITESNGRTIVSFGTGPLYLEQQYIRTTTTELEKAQKSFQGGGTKVNIYAEASKVCQPQAIRNHWAWNSKPYIDCMMGELAKHPSSPEINDMFKTVLPSTNLYRLSYSSPIWAPTPVGFFTVMAAIVILTIILRTSYWLFLRIILIFIRIKRRPQS